MSEISKQIESNLIDKRRNMIETANALNIQIEADGQKYPARIAGAKLHMPIITAMSGLIMYEISWALLERIVRGETKTVIC